MQSINPEKFLDYKFISQLKTNPSKTLGAYLVSKADLKHNQYNSELFYTDGKTKKRALKLKNTSSFIFESEDSVLFNHTQTKREEKEVKEQNAIYYRYTFSSNKLEKAYQFNAPFEIAFVLEDQLILKGTFTKEAHKLYQTPKEDRKALLKALKDASLYEDITDLPFYFNGAGFTSNQREQLFVYNIKTNHIKPVFDPLFNVDLVKMNKDFTKLIILGNHFSNAQSLVTKIYEYDLTLNRLIALYEQDDYAVSNVHFLDDLLLFEATDMKRYGINQNAHFYTLVDGELTLFKSMFDSIGNSLGSDVRLGGNNQYESKDGLYFLTTTEDEITLNKLSLKGELETLYTMDGSIDGFVFLNDKLLMVGLHRQKLQELYELNLVDKKLTQYTTHNRKALANHYIAKPKPVILNQKTHAVKGYVLLPESFDKTQKYPAILDIHGGPKTVYGKVYYHEMQVWANKGYIVFYANPRGSDGKGDLFADIRGKYGTIDYEDLMGFTDLVIKKYPQIDLDNLFVTGGSYGGFMTNWIVGHTNRFKAAVTQRSISNWISFYGTSDIGFYFAQDQTDGHPNLDTDKLWQQSPLKYAMEVKTPLLFIHSDADYRCPIEQAMQFYGILKQKGLDTKLVWFKGENHDLSRSGKPQARLKRLKEITDWFETYRSNKQ
ncbi:MAG: S9 family peptidase [Acholeplasma sp.]|nr:S9 family peptidase [Acholeplasma sp.]